MISPEDVLDVVGAVIFRSPGTPSVPMWVAILDIALIVGASLWILERRVRGVEVIT